MASNIFPNNYQTSTNYVATVSGINSWPFDDSLKSSIIPQSLPLKLGELPHDILNLTVVFKRLIHELTLQFQAINQVVILVLKDYKEEKEWTKHQRYKIWFDKWFDTASTVFSKDLAYPVVGTLERASFPENLSSILTSINTTQKFKKHDNFSEVAFGSAGRYFISKEHRIGLKEFFGFYPEMISTFANTFLYRVIDLKDSSGKERKITIINQKLPDHIRKKYDALGDVNIDRLGPIYEYLTRDIYWNKQLDKSVVGFIKGKSYLEHVTKHIGHEALMTCDINKFYNAINLKSIVDNTIFKKLVNEAYRSKIIDQYPQIKNFISEFHVDLYRPEMLRHITFLRDTTVEMFNTLMYFYTCNGMLPTGSYASPIISNIIMLPFDLYMLDYAYDRKYTYTRYVDDICISCLKERDKNDHYNISIENAKDIEKFLNYFGLFLKYKKTKIFGARDNKVIANLNLPKKAGELPSIGSKYKLEFKKFLDGRSHKDLTPEDLGKLNWIKTVNPKQYEFIISGVKDWPKKKSKFQPLDLAVDYKASMEAAILHGLNLDPNYKYPMTPNFLAQLQARVGQFVNDQEGRPLGVIKSIDITSDHRMDINFALDDRADLMRSILPTIAVTGQIEPTYYQRGHL